MTVLDAIPALAEEPTLKQLMDSFGGAERLRKYILQDFFRYAFNGDGDDGGSCIDGLCV